MNEERNSAMTQFYKKPLIYQERASITDSRNKKKGSITVEAALAIPCFLLAILSLVYLLEMQSIHISAVNALQGAAKIAAEDVVTVPVLNPVKMKSDVVELMGTERIERSIIRGGTAGIHCWYSRYDRQTGMITAKVHYKMQLPFPGFHHIGLQKTEELQVRAWTGYEKLGVERDDNEIVYITATGTVYHKDYHCSYLQPSIQYVPQAQVDHLRNKDGGKYHACARCMRGTSMGGVYITDYGRNYHSSVQCSGLKRTIRAVKKSQCGGRPACSKCGSGN